MLDSHSNVFLTLSGHYHPTLGNRTKVGGRDELLFNQQDAEGQQGAESARILTFNSAEGTIQVQTYDLYSKQFLQDVSNNFTLNTTFRNDQQANAIFPVSAVAAAAVLVLCVVLVAVLVLRRRSRR